ncbi:hypothetical protein ABID26_005378 [Mesorhizobium shonense]|uniref:Uncharacterized protein n=1 Tax=Mesorhizobium shonense TaxID=1209948 RepID=A0ABV2HZG0_9HYPH
MGLVVNHPNAKTVWTTLAYSRGVTSTTITIETDLALNPGDPAFNGAAVQALLDAAALQAGQRGFSADTFQLVEANQPT